MATATEAVSPNGTKAKAGKADAAEAAAQPAIRLKPIEKETIIVPIRGVTPLIMQKWSEKAKNMMREKQSGGAVKPKHGKKVPEDDAEAATYRLPDGTPGLPATAFKAALCDAARMFEGVTMTQLKTCIFVEGVGPEQLVAITGDRTIREDTPRNATGVVDLRYRPQFDPWSADISITYPKSVLDIESVLQLVTAAGDGGVGSWRPSSPKSKSGSYGRFEINTEREVRVV